MSQPPPAFDKSPDRRGDPSDNGGSSEPERPRRASAGSVVKGEFRVLAILSIAVGVLLLLEVMGFLEGVHLLWPVFPTVVGAGLLVAFVQRGRRDLLLLGIGAYLLVASAVFFVCNFTTWAFLESAWPLFIAFLGLVSVLSSMYTVRGRRVLWLSGLLLNIIALVLYLVFEVTDRLWPISLVLFGGWILLVTRARPSSGDTHA
jgi:hypothetical protein